MKDRARKTDSTGQPGLAARAEERSITADLAPIERAILKLRKRWPAVWATVAIAGGDDQLDPAEEATVGVMNAARPLAYIGGRLAAKRALAQAGCGRLVVEADEQGVPVFPTGYLGSIAHKHGRAVAAATRAEATRGVGIDLEFDENHDEESLRAEVVTAAELPALAAVSAADPALLSPATLMLAAKEAVYKAAFPITRTPFDFDETELAFDPGSRSFRALRFPGSEGIAVRGMYELSGRWILVIATAV